MSGDNEKALLGALLLEPQHLPEVMEIVRPADFLAPLGEDIFAAMLEMFSSAEHIDTITVATKMAHHPGLAVNGGGVFLFDLTHHTPSPSAAVTYAHEVAKQATRRRLKGALTRGLQLVEGDIDPDELVEIASNEVLMASRPATSVAWVGATMDDFLATLDQPVRYIPTPWPALNALIGGWAQGRMYVVGARPSVGKSVLAVQAACGLANHGAVALSSLEMSEAEIQARMLANYADIDLGDIQAHKIQPAAIPRLRAAAQQIKGLTLSIDDRPSPSAMDIGANARSLARRMSVAGAVIDYVQLIGDENTTRSRQEEVSAISRQMKLLAKALDIPVIALSQLNRQSQNRADRVPDMSDLRESGSLEQDADVVILLSKKRMKDESGVEYDDPHTILVQVAKNRNGPTGAFTLELQGQYARLRNPALLLANSTYGIGTVIPE